MSGDIFNLRSFFMDKLVPDVKKVPRFDFNNINLVAMSKKSVNNTKSHLIYSKYYSFRTTIYKVFCQLNYAGNYNKTQTSNLNFSI